MDCTWARTLCASHGGGGASVGWMVNTGTYMLTSVTSPASARPTESQMLAIRVQGGTSGLCATAGCTADRRRTLGEVTPPPLCPASQSAGQVAAAATSPSLRWRAAACRLLPGVCLWPQSGAGRGWTHLGVSLTPVLSSHCAECQRGPPLEVVTDTSPRRLPMRPGLPHNVAAGSQGERLRETRERAVLPLGF